MHQKSLLPQGIGLLRPADREIIPGNRDNIDVCSSFHKISGEIVDSNHLVNKKAIPDEMASSAILGYKFYI